MTHVKVDHTLTDDERWLEANSDAFMIHVCALTYSDRQLLDGRIGWAMAERVALPVPTDRAKLAIGMLLALGFWERVGETGYQIVSYEQHAFTAEDIRKTRHAWAFDKKWRRQHKVGEHSSCPPDKCPVARRMSGSDSDTESAETPVPIPNQTQHQLNPTPREGGVGDGAADASAPRSARAPHDASDATEGTNETPAGYDPTNLRRRGLPCNCNPKGKHADGTCNLCLGDVA